MTEPKTQDQFLPPLAPLEMPYQVLERRKASPRWLAVVRQLWARQAPHK